jgi:hypothetical protein
MKLKPLTSVGTILTALYVIVWAFVVLMTWPDVKRLELNQWGDFFAGAMAPLALLWLVLGYFQQSEELRQNTEALRLQADQLKHQVEETRQLVKEASAQAEASSRLVEHQARLARQEELRALPRFALVSVSRRTRGGEQIERTLFVRFHSVGPEVTHLEVI